MDKQLSHLIQNYQASAYAHELVAKHPSLNFAGPTGAGKGTLVTYLTQSGDYAPVVSDTTRTPRPHNDGFEVNGVNYWFINEAEAIGKLKDKAFIEVKAVHQKTMYGTTVASYERVIKAGRTPILEIDVQGIEDLMSHFSDFEAIFLLPPDFDTWQSRLDGRGHMATEDKLRRLASSVIEINTLLSNARFYPVINNEVVETAELISSGAYKHDEYRQTSLEVARTILARTERFLSDNNK